MKVKVLKKQDNSKMCFACGMNNSIGMKSPYYELENGDLLTYFEAPDEYQSYPGRMHGGIAAIVVDEIIGRAVQVNHPDFWGVTIDLALRYHKPVPLNTRLRCVGRIVKESRRVFEGTAEILLPNGDVAITATGRYFKLSMDKIADGTNIDDEMFYVKDDVNEVDL